LQESLQAVQIIRADNTVNAMMDELEVNASARENTEQVDLNKRRTKRKICGRSSLMDPHPNLISLEVFQNVYIPNKNNVT
jgi:hypothetical protein